MSTLYLRLPSKTAADGVPLGHAGSCPFALVARSGVIEREGVATLSELSATLAKVDRVVLLLAASDVTLLRLQVPPLSPARLKAALPSLVEERLIGDPAECALVAGAAVQGLRTVAVVQRTWLETIVQTVRDHGARNIVAVPAQLCLPYWAGSVSAAVVEQAGAIDLTLRLSEHEGIGLPVMSEQTDSSVGEVVQALRALVPEASITLQVPEASLPAYQEAIVIVPGLEQRITVEPDDWSRWIAGARNAGLDLLTGLGAHFGAQKNWRPWCGSIALAVGVAAVNVLGLNVDWWRMKSETDTLRASMVQTYKALYPKEGVILDPAAQIRQKIAAAQRAAGQLASDDFLALAAGFSDAWTSVAGAGKSTAPSVASLEYRDHSLFVHPKAESETFVEPMRGALGARGLSLAQPAAGVWQIRSVK